MSNTNIQLQTSEKITEYLFRTYPVHFGLSFGFMAPADNSIGWMTVGKIEP